MTEGSNETSYDFLIPIDSCGMQPSMDGANRTEAAAAEEAEPAAKMSMMMKNGYENIIIIQNDPKYQEVWDGARLIMCRDSLQDRDAAGSELDGSVVKEKRVVFKPFVVDMLEVIEVRRR